MINPEPIRTFIRSNFYVAEADTLRDDDSLLQSGIVDSTGVVEIVAFLQSRFDIRVAGGEVTAGNLDSIARITEFVRRKLAAKEAAEMVAR